MATPQNSPVSFDGSAPLPTVETLRSRLRDAQPVIERVCSVMGQVGLTYGVLYRGQVVLARGHGFRDAEKRKEADERTLFNIASCTKSFTATACVLLANEGLLELNAPVKRYLPELKEEEATLIDLLAHRTGYARLDMSWVGQRSEVLVSHSELITRVKALPRLRSLRSEWLYNNWMYALVGVIIGRHSKEGNYLDFMKKRLLDEYGLTRSCIQRKDVGDDNISLAYVASQSGRPMEIHEPPWEESPFTPGGGIRSCVLDMLTWARSLLQAYKMESRALSFRSDAWEGKHPGQIFSPRMILPDSICHGQLERSYDLGFMRLMLPYVLSYGGRNSTVAEKVSISPMQFPAVIRWHYPMLEKMLGRSPHSHYFLN